VTNHDLLVRAIGVGMIPGNEKGAEGQATASNGFKTTIHIRLRVVPRERRVSGCLF
jgi:hypothetical protein